MRSQRHLRARVGKDLLVTVTTSDFPLKKKKSHWTALSIEGTWFDFGWNRVILAALLPIDWSRPRVDSGRPVRRPWQWSGWEMAVVLTKRVAVEVVRSGETQDTVRRQSEQTGFPLLWSFVFTLAWEEYNDIRESSVHFAEVEKFTHFFLFYSWMKDSSHEYYQNNSDDASQMKLSAVLYPLWLFSLWA